MEQILRNIIQTYRTTVEKISSRVNSMSRPALLLSLLGASVLLVLLTSQFVEKSGDAVYKWGILRYYADFGIWYPAHADHHQGRWALNIPVLIVMKLFGTAAWAYYIFPFATGIIGALFTYAVTARLSSRIAGLAAFLIFFIFPLTAREDTQFLPMLPACMFILIALYCVLRWLDSEKPLNIVLAGLMTILAYGCKITALYWALAMVLAIGRYSPETRVRFKIFRLKIGPGVIVFSLTIIAGLLIETLLINYFWGFSYGRLQLITGSHINKMPDSEYCSFFVWLLSFLRPLSLHGKYFESVPCFLTFILGMVSAVLCLLKGSINKKFLSFILIVAYFLHCYIVFKIFPFLHPEKAHSRYFIIVAVNCIILYCSSQNEWNKLIWSKIPNIYFAQVLKTALCLIWLITSLIYVCNSWLTNGTIITAVSGEKMFSQAEKEQLPLLLELEKKLSGNKLSSFDRKSALRWLTLFGPDRLIPELKNKFFPLLSDSADRKYLALLNADKLLDKGEQKVLIIKDFKISSHMTELKKQPQSLSLAEPPNAIIESD